MTIQKDTIDQAADALKQGQAVIFPTDTVYGLGIAVGATDGPDVLYRLKERDCGKPIAWLVGGVEDLDRYGRDVPEGARVAARAFWPGPLTLVVHASNHVPVAFRSAAGTVGLRMPNSKTALALIGAVGSPLATTSANLSGHESSSSFAALDPALVARVDVVLADESDAEKSGLASTVLDCTTQQPRTVRAGSITLSDVESLS